MGRDQELKWLAFSLYPLSIFLYSPFNKCLFRLWIGYYRREYKRRKRFFYLRVHKIYCIRYILILTSEILGEHFNSVLTYCVTPPSENMNIKIFRLKWEVRQNAMYSLTDFGNVLLILIQINAKRMRFL